MGKRRGERRDMGNGNGGCWVVKDGGKLRLEEAVIGETGGTTSLSIWMKDGMSMEDDILYDYALAGTTDRQSHPSTWDRR